MADEVQLGSTIFCQSKVSNGVMLKLSISFTSQETEGSVSVLSFFFFLVGFWVFWQLKHWKLSLSVPSCPQAVLKGWCVSHRDK